MPTTVCRISVQPEEKEQERRAENEREKERERESCEVSMDLLTLIANSPSFSISPIYHPFLSFLYFFSDSFFSSSLFLIRPLFTGVRARESPRCKRKITPSAVFPLLSRRRAAFHFSAALEKFKRAALRARIPFERPRNYYGSTPSDSDRKSKILDRAVRSAGKNRAGSTTTARLIARITLKPGRPRGSWQFQFHAVRPVTYYTRSTLHSTIFPLLVSFSPPQPSRPTRWIVANRLGHRSISTLIVFTIWSLLTFNVISFDWEF